MRPRQQQQQTFSPLRGGNLVQVEATRCRYIGNRTTIAGDRPFYIPGRTRVHRIWLEEQFGNEPRRLDCQAAPPDC